MPQTVPTIVRISGGIDMYAKLVIEGKLEILTGLHIGTGGSYSAIGAADSPVIRDARSHLPMIPGSSLKGKIRTLLARQYSPKAKGPKDDDERIIDLFGGTSKRGKLIFNDLFLDPVCLEELRSLGIMSTTEVKFENGINRLSAVANPRQIERVIRGCIFDFDMICDAESAEDAEKSIRLLAEGIQLLQLDYLGGSGSRGYGKVQFKDLTIRCVTGGLPESAVKTCEDILKGVEQA